MTAKIRIQKAPRRIVRDVSSGDCGHSYRATKRRYFCVGSEISISMRLAMSFSG